MILPFYGTYTVDVPSSGIPCNSILVYEGCNKYKHVSLEQLLKKGSSCNIPKCVCDFLSGLGNFPNGSVLTVENGCLKVISQSQLKNCSVDVKVAINSSNPGKYLEELIIGSTYINVKKIGTAPNQKLQISYKGPKTYLELTDTPNSFDCCTNLANCGAPYRQDPGMKDLPYVMVDCNAQKLIHVCKSKYYAIISKGTPTKVQYDPTKMVGDRGMRYIDIPMDGGSYSSHECMLKGENFIMLPVDGPWLIGSHVNFGVAWGVESARTFPYRYRGGKITILSDTDRGGGDRNMAWTDGGEPVLTADTDVDRLGEYFTEGVKLIQGKKGDLIGVGSKLSVANYSYDPANPNYILIRKDNYVTGSDENRQNVDASTILPGVAIENDSDVNNMTYLWAVYIG